MLQVECPILFLQGKCRRVFTIEKQIKVSGEQRESVIKKNPDTDECVWVYVYIEYTQILLNYRNAR